MKKHRIVFIGPAGGGGIPQNGASAKNYHLKRFLSQKGYNIIMHDTENWRSNKFILVKILFSILFYRKATFIVATDNTSGYKLFKVFKYIKGGGSNLIYWVIGGSIADCIKKGIVKASPYKCIDWILVEGQKMKDTLIQCGLKKVIVVPNFKNISISIPYHKKDKKVQFLFLSRIIPEKGADLILQATKELEDKYDFNVDFYGPIEEAYEVTFLEQIKAIHSAEYKGFLDLRDEKNYYKLSQYHAMLFPTYWEGEGFPGIIIDSYVAGVPIIASQWNLNEDIVEEGKTGWLIKVQDVKTLKFAMEQILNSRINLEEMTKNCLNKATSYKIEAVISDSLLRQIGL